MPYKIEKKCPTAKQWMQLRACVGWATFPEEVAQKSLAATPFCVCAFEGEELIGMARVLGDGVISFYIGNVMVVPRWQGLGVGKEIMEVIMQHLRESAAPGAIASLLSIQGKEDFYLQFGFEKRPDATHGHGMSIYF